MNYEETLVHIFSRGRFGIKPGLERIRRLLDALGNPHERFPVIHVAGTNGKGSTASFLSAILRSAGIRAGLFTSPHLSSFTERFRINGSEIGTERLTDLAGRVLAVAPAEATFFELVTALGFLYFAEEGVEAAVVETGMGGRWDATNVVSPLLSIITPISMDHSEYLGSTIGEIAAEKAGIVKQGRPVILAPQPAEAATVIDSRCRETASRRYMFGEEFTASWSEAGLDYRGPSMTLRGLRPGIAGRYQSTNCACALAAAELLAWAGFPVTDTSMRAGVGAAAWPGRMELLPGPPRILLDGAHNAAGAEALAAELVHMRHERLFLVTGVMGEKDAEAILSPLLRLSHHVYAVSPHLDRAMASRVLQQACARSGAVCTNAGTVAAGLSCAMEAAGEGDLIVVTGSLFTVGEARSVLLHREFQPIRG